MIYTNLKVFVAWSFLGSYSPSPLKQNVSIKSSDKWMPAFPSFFDIMTSLNNEPFRAPGKSRDLAGSNLRLNFWLSFAHLRIRIKKKGWDHLRLACSLAYVINKAYFKKGLFHSTKLICDMQFHCYQIWSYVPTAQDGSVAKKVHMKKYAFIKKFTIFTQSLRNFVKMRSSWLTSFDLVS